jgi:prevent-host-death family protein
VTAVNVHEAKTHLSRLLLRVEAGEEVLILRAGTPVARLVPANPHHARRKPGLDVGKGFVGDDFNSPLPKTVLARFRR